MSGRNRIPMTSGVGTTGSSNIINGGSESKECPYKDRGPVYSCADCIEVSQLNPLWATTQSPDDCPKKGVKKS
jgi:hypothetical protein